MNRFEKKENIEMYEVYKKEHSDFLRKASKLAIGSKKVLLLGCGSGREPKLFCDIVDEVIGIDISHNMIETAKKNEPRCKYYVGDAIEVLRDNEDLKDFDYIIGMSNFLGYYNESRREELLDILQNRLKKGGKALFSIKCIGDVKFTRIKTFLSFFLSLVKFERYEFGDIYFVELDRKSIFKNHWFLRSKLKEEFGRYDYIILNQEGVLNDR